jgi:outer membrane biosynthesis protein TonB
MNLAIPYQDHSRTPMAFVLSVLLHGLLAGVLAAFFFIRPAPKINSTDVMELVAGPSTTDVPDDAPASNPADSSLSVPNLSSLENTKTSQPIVQPSSPPSEPPPTPNTAKPPPPAVMAPGSGPRATPPTKIINWADWIKKHLPARSGQRATTTPTTVPKVGVDPSGIEKNLQNLGNRSGAPSHTGQTMSGANGSSDDYEARLIQRVHDAFSPPQGYDGLSAEISLTIAADGSIVRKEFIRPSGTEAFDNAVRRTLNLLTNVDPPPDGKEITRVFHLVPKTP